MTEGNWVSLSQPSATLGDSDVGFVPRCSGPAPNPALQRTERSRCSCPAAERGRWADQSASTREAQLRGSRLSDPPAS